MTRRLLPVMLVLAVVALAACDALKSAPAGPSAQPIISVFTAEPLSTKSGTLVTLRWDVQGEDVDVRIDPGVGNVPATGSATVAPIVTTTYTLNARNRSGQSAQRVLTVTITP